MVKKNLIITLLVTSVGVGSIAFAERNIKSITAYINTNLKLTFDGQAFNPKESDGTELYPLIYNNRIYLPFRTLSEKAGFIIEQNIKDNSISIKTKQSVTETNNTHNNVKTMYYEQTIIGEWEWVSTAGGFSEQSAASDSQKRTIIFDKNSNCQFFIEGKLKSRGIYKIDGDRISFDKPVLGMSPLGINFYGENTLILDESQIANDGFIYTYTRKQ